MRSRALFVWMLLIACSKNSGEPAVSPDARNDTRPEAGADRTDVPATDASSDVGPTPVDGAPEVTPDAPADAAPDGPLAAGRWTTGDLHVHTSQSNDAQTPQSLLRVVLDAAFDRNRLDWIALSNHLRVSDRDHENNPVPGGPVPFSKGAARFEIPAVNALLAAGTYPGRTIFTSVEWDMPTHEHFNVGILSPGPGAPPAARALEQFEYLFTNRDASQFDPADVAAWGSQRFNATHADAMAALAWLKQHHPRTSYGVICHPTRYPDRYKISDFREMNDLAPDIVFAIEGMVGNQMEPDRGGYASPHVEANAHARTYGGADSVIARVGGVWDALLGEGRRIWNVGSSDYHFKTASGMFSSGYFPGEYTRTHVWVEGEAADFAGVLAGLRAGRSFAVNGDLISALDFTVTGPGGAVAGLGGELRVPRGSTVTVTVRWRSALPSRYESPVGSGMIPGRIPAVDHVDLIGGDVGGRAQPGTPGYAAATNPTAKVAARFAAAAVSTDAQGWKVATHSLTVTRSQYFRLRGTNLGTDVAGETSGGEPLADLKTEGAEHQARFDAINERNYRDLWFYANPIFVTVE